MNIEGKCTCYAPSQNLLAIDRRALSVAVLFGDSR